MIYAFRTYKSDKIDYLCCGVFFLIKENLGESN